MRSEGSEGRGGQRFRVKLIRIDERFEDQNRDETVRGEKMQTQELFDKIQSLPPKKIAVVEDFVEFLRYRDDDILLRAAAAKLSEKSFQKVWDNQDDAEYDNLSGSSAGDHRKGVAYQIIN